MLLHESNTAKDCVNYDSAFAFYSLQHLNQNKCMFCNLKQASDLHTKLLALRFNITKSPTFFEKSVCKIAMSVNGHLDVDREGHER